MGSATHEQITGTAAKIESSPHPRQAAKDALGLRALFVLNSLDVGGSETKTVRLVNSMLNRGVTAGIAYLNDSDALREQLSADAPLWPLHRRGKFSIAAVRSIRRIVAQHAPDVVFSVNMYPALYVALATAGHRRRPLVVALLNTTALEARDEWRRTFYRPFLRRFDQIVFGCQLQRKEWSAHLRLQDANSSVIYNGIDVDRFAPWSSSAAAVVRSELGISPTAFVFGSVGRLAPEKNQGVLIDALAELRARGVDAHLLLVGDGSRRSSLEELVKARGMSEHATFAGSQRDVRPFLSAMDVFVLPSSHVETFSNAALEAMSMSRAVVLSRIGGAAEMVGDGIEGFTLQVDSLARELPHVLRRLHDDPELRARLGRAARERVESRFSLCKMVDDFCALTAAARRDTGVS